MSIDHEKQDHMIQRQIPILQGCNACCCQSIIKSLKVAILQRSLENQTIKQENTRIMESISAHNNRINDPWKDCYQKQKKQNQQKLRYIESLNRKKQFTSVTQILRSNEKNTPPHSNQKAKVFRYDQWYNEGFGTKTTTYLQIKRNKQNQLMHRQTKKSFDKTWKKSAFMKNQKSKLKISQSQISRKQIS